jgi:hypothetical protein
MTQMKPGENALPNARLDPSMPPLTHLWAWYDPNASALSDTGRASCSGNVRDVMKQAHRSAGASPARRRGAWHGDKCHVPKIQCDALESAHEILTEIPEQYVDGRVRALGKDRDIG